MKNMELVGDILRNSRESKNIEKQDIANELNIGLDLIDKIETNNFLEDYNNVYILGHIRAYAKFLALDQNKIVRDFKIQNSFNHKTEISEIAKPYKKNNIRYFSKPISIGSMIFISLTFYFFFINNNNNFQQNYALTPDLPENFESELEEIQLEVALNDKANKEKLIIKEKKLQEDMYAIEILNNENIQHQTSAVASTDYEINDAQSLDKITLKFLNQTWIQLRDNKDLIVLSKLMDKNEEYSYNVSDSYILTAGNAGNILVLLNGKVKGKAGKQGEVIDSLIINSDFEN